MARVSVQFCRFDRQALYRPSTDDTDRLSDNTMQPSVLGDRLELDVTGTATAGGSRPALPVSMTHAIVIPLSGEVLAQAGSDATATQASRFLPLLGFEYVIPMKPGELLSFIQRT